MTSPPAARARGWHRLATAALLLAGCTLPLRPPAPQPLATPYLRLIGTAELATRTDFGNTTVGGLSGIDYSPERGEYLLVSDDNGIGGPARIYTARLSYGAHALSAPEFTGMQPLHDPGGQPFASSWWPRPGVDRPDAEAVRWLPGGQSLLWSSEGDFGRGFGPQLRESLPDGRYLRAVALPAGFAPQEGGRGPRANGTLEGLALTPDGRGAWLSMELPLRQDGEPATPADPGAPVRLTAIELPGGRVLRQIAYPPDRVPLKRRLPGPQLNGVSEILMEGSHHLLVLERSYSAGAGFGARLYRIDTRDGSDTRLLDALSAGNHRPVAKTLVADLAALGIALDNIEGMTWGPRLPDGGCVLVFVSDNNFNPAQVTQFIAARYHEPPGGPGQCTQEAR